MKTAWIRFSNKISKAVNLNYTQHEPLTVYLRAMR